MRLAEGVAASRERNGLLMVHRHALECFLDVACGLQRIGHTARPFGIDVNEAHLDRGERPFDLQTLVRVNAGLDALIDPFVLAAPVDIALRLEHVGAPPAKAEDRPTHALDGDIAGEDEQIGPADVLAVFLLDRPQQAARLVEVAVVGPAIERGEALLAAVRAAAPVRRAISARRVPGHADEEGAIMPVIRWPPGLAVRHQGMKIGLQRFIVELPEGFGIVKVRPHRIGRAVGVQDLGCQHIRPPVLVGTAEKGTAGAVHRTAGLRVACLHVHEVSPKSVAGE